MKVTTPAERRVKAVVSMVIVVKGLMVSMAVLVMEVKNTR